MIVRPIVARLLFAAFAFTVVALSFGVLVAFRLGGVAGEVRAAVVDDLRDGRAGWQDRVDRWVLPEKLALFAIENRDLRDDSLNAVAILWPDGLGEERSGFRSRCRFFPHQGPSGPAWEQRADRWAEAASCEELDDVVAAARASRFDFHDPAVASATSPERIRFHHDLYHDLGSGVGALLARAHLRLVEGDTAVAERDLRTLVSLGLLLIDRSPDVRGLEMGHSAIRSALEFFEAIRAAEGMEEEAALASSLRTRLPPLEGCRGLIKSELPATAAVREGWETVARVAEREELPFAIRLSALEAVRLRYTDNPRELLLGPHPARIERARQLAAAADLAPWWDFMDRYPMPAGYRGSRLLEMIL